MRKHCYTPQARRTGSRTAGLTPPTTPCRILNVRRRYTHAHRHTAYTRCRNTAHRYPHRAVTLNYQDARGLNCNNETRKSFTCRSRTHRCALSANHCYLHRGIPYRRGKVLRGAAQASATTAVNALLLKTSRRRRQLLSAGWVSRTTPPPRTPPPPPPQPPPPPPPHTPRYRPSWVLLDITHSVGMPAGTGSSSSNLHVPLVYCHAPCFYYALLPACFCVHTSTTCAL